MPYLEFGKGVNGKHVRRTMTSIRDSHSLRKWILLLALTVLSEPTANAGYLYFARSRHATCVYMENIKESATKRGPMRILLALTPKHGPNGIIVVKFLENEYKEQVRPDKEYMVVDGATDPKYAREILKKNPQETRSSTRHDTLLDTQNQVEELYPRGQTQFPGEEGAFKITNRY